MFAILAALLACDTEPAPAGQLMVSFETDMALSRQIDTMHIQVLIQGRTQFDQMYRVGYADRDAALPATLALVAGDDPSQPVTVRVAGRKNATWRTFREAITTVPTDRVATLRMPIQWLCDGFAVRAPDARTDQFPRSTCGEGNTCRAGECFRSELSSDELPDYRPEQVFGGAPEPEDGQCFDTVACMRTGTIAEPDADCSIENPGGETVNVALRVADGGICDGETNTSCFVPLDGRSTEGWTLTRDLDRITLPKAVCEKLDEGTISAVYVSTDCETKIQGIPPCGQWSSVDRTHAIRPSRDVQAPASVARITTLPISNSLGPCCPLMSDGDRLFTCVCATESAASIFEILPLRLGHELLMTVTAPERDYAFFSANVFEGTLYWWSGTDEVQRTPLSTDAAALAPLQIEIGSIYETASLLVDASGAYALATGLGMGSPVQVLKLQPDGETQAWDTGGAHSVLQFDDDASGVYVATAVDTPIMGGARFERRSSVVRLDKATGEAEVFMPEVTVTTEAPDQGGYSGVQVDDRAVYALFGATPTADGRVLVEVRRRSLEPGAPDEPEVVHALRLDPERSRLRLQGAVDGAVVLTRVESESSNMVSSSVWIVPEGGPARVVAGFVRDAPVPGLGVDAERIYWLNGTGQVYGLPREALR